MLERQRVSHISCKHSGCSLCSLKSSRVFSFTHFFPFSKLPPVASYRRPYSFLAIAAFRRVVVIGALHELLRIKNWCWPYFLSCLAEGSLSQAHLFPSTSSSPPAQSPCLSISERKGEIPRVLSSCGGKNVDGSSAVFLSSRGTCPQPGQTAF